MMNRDKELYEGLDPMSVALGVAKKRLRPTIHSKMIPEFEGNNKSLLCVSFFFFFYFCF